MNHDGTLKLECGNLDVIMFREILSLCDYAVTFNHLQHLPKNFGAHEQLFALKGVLFARRSVLR